MSTHNDAMADALIEEVKQLRDLVFTICSERDQLQADLAAARELLQSLRSLVPEAYRHHITAALAGEKK